MIVTVYIYGLKFIYPYSLFSILQEDSDTELDLWASRAHFLHLHLLPRPSLLHPHLTSFVQAFEAIARVMIYFDYTEIMENKLLSNFEISLFSKKINVVGLKRFWLKWVPGVAPRSEWSPVSLGTSY